MQRDASNDRAMPGLAGPALMLWVLVMLFAPIPWTALRADTWRGTAPFCAGECQRGEIVKGRSKYGDGGYCVTGHKVLCGNNSPNSCPITSTRASCYGAIMICENGHQDSRTQQWQTCNTYACGVCAGFGDLGPASLGGGAKPDLCQPGYVWRETVPGDHVCVTPATRAQASADNAAAGQRRAAGGGPSGPDTCKQGFVWREAEPSDHVCVTREIRAATAADNRADAGRKAPVATRSVIDTCKQGFVWREAVEGDRVCVPPQTRAQAAADNASAASRRAPQGGPAGPDTCLPGFVWREVIPTDHVCVMPETRTAIAEDATLARERRGP